jgi:hypothetical protein
MNYKLKALLNQYVFMDCFGYRLAMTAGKQAKENVIATVRA